jgi:hypothetical protein
VRDGEWSPKEFGIEDCVLFALDFFRTAMVSSNVERVLQIFAGASDFSVFELMNPTNLNVIL